MNIYIIYLRTLYHIPYNCKCHLSVTFFSGPCTIKPRKNTCVSANILEYKRAGRQVGKTCFTYVIQDKNLTLSVCPNKWQKNQTLKLESVGLVETPVIYFQPYYTCTYVQYISIFFSMLGVFAILYVVFIVTLKYFLPHPPPGPIKTK